MAHTDPAALHMFHSHRQAIPYPPAGYPAGDGATDHDHDIAYRAAAGARPWGFIPSRVVPAPMVDVGDGACADQVLAGPWVPPGPVLLAGDETVTEHPGPKVVGQGRQGEGVRASHRDTADRWGPHWAVGSVLVKLPLATRPWALPVLVAVAPSSSVGS
jgi:hypothetical protein